MPSESIESICPIRKKVEIAYLDLENWMPIELCEGCTGRIVFSFFQKSYRLKTYIHQLVSELYKDREQGNKGPGPGSTFLPSKSSCVGFHTVK